MRPSSVMLCGVRMPGPQPTPGIPDRIQEKPPLTPAQDPSDTKNPEDPPLNPALLPIGDPAGAA